MPPSGYSVGSLQLTSGFFPVFVEDGGLLWLCPACKLYVAKRAEEIALKLRTTFVSMVSLVPEETRKLIGEP